MGNATTRSADKHAQTQPIGKTGKVSRGKPRKGGASVEQVETDAKRHKRQSPRPGEEFLSPVNGPGGRVSSSRRLCAALLAHVVSLS